MRPQNRESSTDLTTNEHTRFTKATSWKAIPALITQAIAALAFAIMFISFLVQVFTRYVLNAPLAWTSEICSIAYLWIAFWGGGLIVRRQDQVRFDLIYQHLPPSRQRVAALLGSAVLLAVYLRGFPPNLDFVRFMGYDRTWVLELRFDLVFSAFLVFLAGTIMRKLVRIVLLSRKDWRKAVDSRRS